MSSTTNSPISAQYIDTFIAGVTEQIQEYARLDLSDTDGSPQWTNIARQLCSDDSWDDPMWSPEAAAELCKLARKYGSHMLGNAAALAVACQMEDGDPDYQRTLMG